MLTPQGHLAGSAFDRLGVDEVRLHWRSVCSALVASAHLHGFDATDITITGTPLRLAIGSWCSVVLIEGPREPIAVVRSMAPGSGCFTVDICGGDPAVVAADIADAVDALRRRRARVLDEDRRQVELELADMTTSTGWHCDGVGGRKPLTAAFRDDLDRIRGRLIRTDRADGDPAAARFGIVMEVSSLTYAQALAVLAALRVVSDRAQQSRSAPLTTVGVS